MMKMKNYSVICISILVLCLFAGISQHVKANGSIINSNRMTTAVTVDGVWSTGEWDDAAEEHVTSGTEVNFEYYLYVKNDDKWIYVFMDVVGDITQDISDKGNLLFDTGHDEVLTHEGEDTIHCVGDGINRHLIYNATWGYWAYVHCTSTSGVSFTDNGRDETGMVAAAGFGESPNSDGGSLNHRIYEFKIPMALGDLNAYPGYTAGIWVYIWDATSSTDSLWPGDSSVWTPSSYGDLVLDPCTIYVKGDYSTIQEAIDNAYEGDTIIVESGTYNEAIEIDKRLTIQGQNRATTIINGMGETRAVWIDVTAENVKFSGFTIHNASTGIAPWIGAEISDCIIYNCDNKGIQAISLHLSSSPPSITIENCIVYDNGDDGIYVSDARKTSSNIRIENCVSYGNGGDGIGISESKNIRIENCVTYNNYRGIALFYVNNATVSGCESYSNGDDGIHLDFTDHSSVINCDTYDNSGDGIALGDSNYVQIRDCDSYINSDKGIYLWYSYSSKIENCNTYENSDDGVHLLNSDNAFLKKCDSYDNGDDGFELNTLENSRLMACKSYGNGDGGIILSHSDYINVQGCEIYNHNSGIYIEYSHSVSICNSTSHNNNYYGMYIFWTNFLYASKSAFYDNSLDGIYADYSNSTIIFCNITDNGDGGITATNSDMLVRYCNIENNTDDGLYDINTCFINATECWWGNETGPYNVISNPSGTGDPCDVLDFEPWTTEPVTPFPLMSDLRCRILRAETNSVYYVPTGNIYDDSTFYAFYAYKEGPQIITPPTQSSASSAFLDVDGSPLFDGDIVTFGGKFANRLVSYYEDAGIAKIGFANNGTHRIFRRISDGAHVYAVDSSTYNETEKDYFVFQIYADGDRYILTEWGIRAPGTYAGGICFIDIILPNVGSFTSSYFVFSWTDVNGDGKPQPEEIAIEASGN